MSKTFQICVVCNMYSLLHVNYTLINPLKQTVKESTERLPSLIYNTHGWLKPDKYWTWLKLQTSALWKILIKEWKDMTDWEKNIYKSCTWWRSCMQIDCLKQINL